MQMPLFETPTDWRPTPVADLPPWPDGGRVAIDLETRDDDLKLLGPGVRRGGYVAGISFAIEDGPAYYLPVRHAGGDNLPEEHVWPYLREQAAQFRGVLVGANLQYELDYLWEAGIEFPRVQWYRDVQVADPLIDELQDSYSLEDIAKRWGLPGKDERQLRWASEDYGVHPKLELWKLPARHVAAYAIQDSALTLDLLRRQEREIDSQDLWAIYDLESRLLPVLVRMRRRGVRVSRERLQQLEDWSWEVEKECLQVVYAETGVRIKPGDTAKKEPLAKALEKAGVSVTRTGKLKQPQIENGVLEKIDHPVPKALARARQFAQLRNTFVEGIRKHLVGERIHCTFNQLRRNKDEEDRTDVRGTRFGRLSSTDPNLQQQPIRHPEIGKRWRAIYLPEEGLLWGSLDYSQQEPRLTHHYAELAGCTKADVAAQQYRDNPDLDNHQMLADMTGVKRSYAKTIYLGLTYSMGGAKLCHRLDLPTKWVHSRRRKKMIEVAGPEGEALFKQFHGQAPYLQELAKLCESTARTRGYVKTLLGRRCRFPRRDDGAFDWTHKALNRVIQGSAADQTKLALVEGDAAGYEIQLQVHDELDQSFLDREHAEGLAEIMRNCVPLRVPVKVDVELGPSWGEAE